MISIFSNKRERKLLAGAFFSLLLLCLVEYRPHLWSFLSGSSLEKILVSEGLYKIVSGLLVGLISAYIIYVAIELLPRIRREKGVFRALNLLVATILDSYDKTKIFGHEQPISTIDIGVLDEAWLETTKNKLKKKESEFFKLKYAMETAYTRLDDCRHALSMASIVSPEAGVQWLQITDRVRLLAEEYGQQPEVSVENQHLINKDIKENPLYLYRLTLMQRIHELIVDVEVWLGIQNGENRKYKKYRKATS